MPIEPSHSKSTFPLLSFAARGGGAGQEQVVQVPTNRVNIWNIWGERGREVG